MKEFFIRSYLHLHVDKLKGCQNYFSILVDISLYCPLKDNQMVVDKYIVLNVQLE